MEGRRADVSCTSCFFSLILPAYNEAEGIVQALEEADAAFARLGFSCEIVVVDDGSSDTTVEKVVHFLQGRPDLSDHIRLLRHPVNRGYGAALRTGFEAARGERIGFTDADCQFDLADLAKLIPLTEYHAVAVGYRQDRQDSWKRCFFSRGYNFLARSLLGTSVQDIDCALKVFRRDALHRILPESSGFFVNTEMLTNARLLGLEVIETRVRHRPRAAGTSKVALVDIPKTLNALLPFWWNKVLFTGRSRRLNVGKAGAIGFACLLLLMSAVLFLGRLSSPLLEPEEARYAEIPRQMLAEGQFLIPTLHGEPYLHKPPLLYWLVMGSYQVFGVHDWAARLVPALASIGVVLVTFGWAWRAVGPWAGCLSGLILVLCPRFIYMGGMLNFDSLLCFWVGTGLACAHRAMAEGKLSKSWWVISALACGLGIMTKGPVALVLILAPIAAWPFLERRAARVSWRGWFSYLLVAVGVATPWHVLFAWHNGPAFADFIWLHHVQRFVAPLDHEKPFWYFVPMLVVGTLPWSLLLIPCLVYLTRRTRAAGRRRPPALGFMLLAFLTCLGFFSLAGCKRPAYILPLFPLLALILGTFLAEAVPVKLWRRRTDTDWGQNFALRLGQLLSGATLAVGLAFVGLAGYFNMLSWTSGLILTAILMSLVLVVARSSLRRRAWLSAGGGVAALFGLLIVGVFDVLPDYHDRFALRDQVHEQAAGPEQTPDAVVSFPKRWDSISFYLQRDDVVTYPPEQQARMIEDLQKRGQTLLFVKRQGALQNLLQALPPALEFVPRGSTEGNVVTGLVRPR